SPGGIVNLVSKRPRDDAQNEIVASTGNFAYRQIAADIGGKLDRDGRWLYRLVALNRDAETQVDFVENNVVAISPSISYQPSDDTSLTLLLNYQDATGDAGAQFLPISGTLNAAPNGQFFDSELFVGEPEFSQYDGTTKSASILADHRFNDTWSVQFAARRTEGERDYSQAWIAFGFSADRFVRNADGSLYNGGAVPRSFYQSDASSEQTAADLRFRANFDTGAVNHELMVGGQYQDVTTDENPAYAYAVGYDFATGGPDQVFGDSFWINPFSPEYGNVPSQALIDSIKSDAPEVNVKDLGLYINDQMTLGNWHWNIGVRFDDVSNESGQSSQDDDATSIATGLLYAFDNGLSPYISYAESFETVVGLDAVTQQAFKPQEGEQIEVGIKYSFANSPNYLTIAYFDIEQSNLLTSTIVGQTQAGGIDTVSGVEFEAKFDFGDIQLETNASKLDTQTAAGFQFVSVPETNASAWLGYGSRFDNGFRAGVGVRYAGESFGGADAIETPAYTLLDAMVAYKLENWTLRLNARNLSDKAYQSTCLSRGDCFQGERRTIVGTASYAF
ncbi:MAG: TonB-dependent receptor, partial [Arenicella sp.]|nr:TonB-dependent receptor [Arenicella sp.]